MNKITVQKKRLSRPNDARAVRSQEALKAALLRLIESNPFDQISIRDITTEAGVSYPVFFRRYETREELLEDIATSEIRQLLSLSMAMFDADQQQASLAALCHYVDAHRKLWTRLLTGGAAPTMRAEFIRIAREIGGSRPRSNPWLPVDLAAKFVVGGLFEILAWWLEQADDYPIGNVVKIIDALIVRSTARPIDVRLADHHGPPR